jgi:hypothetical protein
MTIPRVGVTHDVVIYPVANSAVGLVVRPGSYRVDTAPKFLPQLTAGNLSAADYSWLRSLQLTVAKGLGPADSDATTLVEHVADMRDGVIRVGEGVMPSLVPMYMSQAVGTNARFSQGINIKFFTMSLAPHVTVQDRGLFVFTQDAWVHAHTTQNGVGLLQVQDVIMHSNVAFFARAGAIIAAYGNTGTNPAARPYLPVFSHTTTWAFEFTQVDRIYNYDRRLWKTAGNKIAYWEATQKRWSDWQDVGEASTVIRNTESFTGRKFFGKDDGLWVYDAGRVYQIEDYSTESWSGNFALMRAYKGCLYYNIGQRLLRYTAGGSIEEIPWYGGSIFGGVGGMGRLLIVGYEKFGIQMNVWAFNPDTGTMEIVLSQATNAASPYKSGNTGRQLWSIAQSYIQPRGSAVMLAPANFSASSRMSSFMAYTGYRRFDEDFHDMQISDRPAVLTWPNITCGLLGVTKHLIRAKVHYKLGDVLDRITVYYRVHGAPLPQPSLHYGLANSVDLRAANLGPALQDFITCTGSMLRFGSLYPFNSLTVYWSRPVGVTDNWYSGVIAYWNGTAMTAFGAIAANETTYLGLKAGYEFYKTTLSLNVPPDWALYTTITGYLLDFSIPGYFAFRFYYFELAYRTNYPEYTEIGTVTDRTQTFVEFALPAPVPFTTLSILATVKAGTQFARPILKAIELEYTLPESDKLQVTGTAVLVDNMELENGEVVHEAAAVTTTLFSTWVAQKPIVAALPYPPPQGHTRRMVLTVAPPGISVPWLSYGPTDHSTPGAEFTFNLREV